MTGTGPLGHARRVAVASWLVSALLASAAASAAPATPGAPGPASGARAPGAPALVPIDAAGLKRLIKQRRGKPLVLHFWASWCYPCVKELPVLDKVARGARARGVELVSVSLDPPSKPRGAIAQLLELRAPSLTRHIATIHDPDQFVAAFEGWDGAIPALFAYGPDGRLRGSVVMDASERELQRLITTALEPLPGEPGPKHGRRRPDR